MSDSQYPEAFPDQEPGVVPNPTPAFVGNDGTPSFVGQQTGMVSVAPGQDDPNFAEFGGWDTGDVRRNPGHLGDLRRPYGGSPINGCEQGVV